MNRNTLLIAVAAIVVVGIAVGLFLAGTGQNGKLSGAIGPGSTSINLSLSGCSPPDSRGLVSFTVAGYLVDSGGLPVANRTVNLVAVIIPETGPGLSAVEQLVTRADGSFRVSKSARPLANSTGDNYQAFFGGDAQYGASSSEKVYRSC